MTSVANLYIILIIYIYMTENKEILDVYKAYGYPSAQKLVQILNANGLPTVQKN